jgi:uncharacterized protein YuzE
MEKLKVWFDQEGDLLEVGFVKKRGFMKSIGDDIFLRLDQKGNVLGFAVLNATKRFEKIKEIELPVKGKLVSAE